MKMTYVKTIALIAKNPKTVFSSVPAPEMVSGKLSKKEEGNHRSMFPIILGITTSFFVVLLCSVLMIFFSSGGTSKDGFASASGIRQRIGEYRFDSAAEFVPDAVQQNFTNRLEQGDYFVADTDFEKAVLCLYSNCTASRITSGR